MRIRKSSMCLCVTLLVVALGGCGSAPSTSTGAPGAGSASGTSGSGGSAPGATVPAPPPVVVDAGASLVVTLNESISTKNRPGDQFDASVAEPVMAGNTLVVSPGAKVSGVVTTAKEAGHIKGSATLALTLESVTVNGQRYPIHASVIERASKGRGERTAIGAGAGAGVGAIVGALAGKGKGALIGAAVGGGGGTAATALTGNREVTISTEEKLRFKLTQPLQIPAN